ncbi:hypothetical protein TNCV_4126881 [Trichonephila clavipes]|uniref:Uncharacterized protein n=1 Tax=Trichonephila clavipes TaxID=2585209 RepID=A0A8X6STP5_TRICX|nr:hypothetical protein TNCV_4126881 [Trichonephila clavipes]
MLIVRILKNKFQNSVDKNETLTKIDNFSYLKSLLGGAAGNAVNAFVLSDDNYGNALIGPAVAVWPPQIVRVHYFVRGGFVGHRSCASSKHLSPHLPVDELDSSGVKKGLRCSCKMHVWVSGPQRSRLDVDVSEK